jgi:PPE-repeat protein
MTAPIWMAVPPEVHSALLDSGPGPESLLSAAAAWNTLSAEYGSAADEIIAELGSVQAGAWDGPSAESYVAAHAPYVTWLFQASADGAAAAAQHEAAAASYAAAVSAMPTLPELAANHVIHGVLAATNFFGINAIPIALNEADYVRMWIQAATTMASYEAASGAAVAATPQATPAPQIVKFDAAAIDTLQEIDQVFQQVFQQIEKILPYPQLLGSQIFDKFLQAMGYSWDPANGTINGIPYLSYNNPLSLIYWITRALGYSTDFQTFVRALVTNPLQLLQSLGSLTPLQVISYLALHPVLAIAIATAPLYSLTSAASAVAAVSVAGPADTPDVSDVPVAAAPADVAPATVATASHAAPGFGGAPTVAAPTGGAPAAPAPAASATAASAPPSAPPAQAFLPYAIPAGPAGGWGSGYTGRSGTGATVRAPAVDVAAVAAAAATRRRARKRLKEPEVLREYADAYADLDPDIDPDAPAEAAESDRGAGSLGFAGTISKRAAQAAGLAVLGGDRFGGGPVVPMVPGTWDPDAKPAGDVD